MEIRIYTVGDYPYTFYAIGANANGTNDLTMLSHFNTVITTIKDNERFPGVWFESGLKTQTYSEYIVHGNNNKHEQDIILDLACVLSELFACEVIII